MPELYFVREQYALTDRNALDKEVREFVKANFDHTLVTEEQLKEMYKEVCKVIREKLNPKYKAVKKKIFPSSLRFYDETCRINNQEGLHYEAYNVYNNQLQNLTESQIKLIFLNHFLN